MQAEVQANRTAIQELTVQVSSLTKNLEKVLTPVVNVAPENTRNQKVNASSVWPKEKTAAPIVFDVDKRDIELLVAF